MRWHAQMDKFQGGHYSSYYFLDTALRAGLHLKAHCHPTFLPLHLYQQACHPLDPLPRKVVDLDLSSYLDRSKALLFFRTGRAPSSLDRRRDSISCHLT